MAVQSGHAGVQYAHFHGHGIIGKLSDDELAEIKGRVAAKGDARFRDTGGRGMVSRDLNGKVIVYRNGKKALNGSRKS